MQTISYIPGHVVDHEGSRFVVLSTVDGVTKLRAFNGAASKLVNDYSGLALVSAEELTRMAKEGWADAARGLLALGLDTQWPPRDALGCNPIPELEDIIEDCGWAVQMPCSQHMEVPSKGPFFWTVGLHDKKFPEIVVSGLSQGFAVGMLNFVATQLLALREANAFDPAKAQAIALPDCPYPFYWCPVDREKVAPFALTAMERSEGQVCFAQLVVPDVNGAYPWELRYLTEKMQGQAFFGNGDVPSFVPAQTHDGEATVEGALFLSEAVAPRTLH